MSRRRTDTTRVDQVRTSSKQLAEMMIYFAEVQGWKIESIGGFLRDVMDQFYYLISQQEGFQELSGTAEAEEILQEFKTGRVNKQHLSLTVEQEEWGNPYTIEIQAELRGLSEDVQVTIGLKIEGGFER